VEPNGPCGSPPSWSTASWRSPVPSRPTVPPSPGRWPSTPRPAAPSWSAAWTWPPCRPKNARSGTYPRAGGCSPSSRSGGTSPTAWAGASSPSGSSPGTSTKRASSWASGSSSTSVLDLPEALVDDGTGARVKPVPLDELVKAATLSPRFDVAALVCSADPRALAQVRTPLRVDRLDAGHAGPPTPGPPGPGATGPGEPGGTPGPAVGASGRAPGGRPAV
jgi:hypothetical protein